MKNVAGGHVPVFSPICALKSEWFIRWKGRLLRLFRGIRARVSVCGCFFERPTLRGCQRWGALCRVKPLCNLTLPCQKTNPDGVIWDGKRLGMVVCGNRIEFDGVIWGANEWRMGFRRSMDYLRWAFVGSKYRRMALEARENGLQKKKGQSSMDYCWWQALKNGDGSLGKWAFMPCGVCGNNPKPLRAAAHGRAWGCRSRCRPLRWCARWAAGRCWKEKTWVRRP